MNYGTNIRNIPLNNCNPLEKVAMFNEKAVILPEVIMDLQHSTTAHNRDSPCCAILVSEKAF